MNTDIDTRTDATNDKVVLLIMNCVRYRYKADKQKETWLKDLQLPYYHVLGNPELTTTYQFDHAERILWVNTPDDYNSLPKKVIVAYASIKQSCPNLQYIFKTDDDQMLQSNNPNKFFDNMIKMLEKRQQTNKVHYAGNLVDVPKAYMSQYYRIHPELPKELPVYVTKYCSGRFYVLSTEAIADLILKREKISSEYLEDYAVGMHLHNRYKNPILHIDTDFCFKDILFDSNNISSSS
jgi:hypothetical protein